MENETGITDEKSPNLKHDDEIKFSKHSLKRKYTYQRLSKELSNKPHILKFILYLQKCLKKRKKTLKKVKEKLEKLKSKRPTTKNVSTQTGSDLDAENVSWNVNKGENVSLVDQVKEAAESALQQTGMVYEETSGMYYDYNTGYYYNANTGLYYHSSTGCYYYFDKDQNTFVFHSQADINDFPMQNEGLENRKSKKSKHKGKDKKEKQKQKEDLPDDTSTIHNKDKENLHKRSNDGTESRAKKSKVNDSLFSDDDKLESRKKAEVDTDDSKLNSSRVNDKNSETNSIDSNLPFVKSDGECSSSDEESSSSSSNESISSRYPPCIRMIISETSLSKLKVGSLFILTKEGGTLGREGDKHAVIIPEENISKHHLTFVYNEECSSYYVKDVGSRNGTILNGTRMSLSKVESDLVKLVHGSVLQLGSTKILCHIHKGSATCGHCEPGLLIKDDEPIQKIYKPVNLKAMHKKELYRLKEKYKVKPAKTDDDEKLMPEGYEDKAQIRRETVGSTHDSVKTEQASLDTTISSENKGFKLLQKMGWSVGDGLGKTSQGTTDPVPLLSNQGTSGLGTGSLSTPSSSSLPSSQISMRRQGIWLAAQKRYDKATTSSIFNQDESDEEEPTDKK